MNHQEIFNTVLDHFAAQKGRATRGIRGACAYRGNDGGKCAAGVLIPDACYDPAIDDEYGVGWGYARGILAENPDTPAWLVSADNEPLICALQSVHDWSLNWEKPEEMWDHMVTVAKDFKLNSWKVDATVSAIFPGYRHKTKAPQP